MRPIICVFPENIISRFDIAVNDVAEEFAERSECSSIEMASAKLLRSGVVPLGENASACSS